MGTARIPTVQISSRVRATGESPWPSYQAPAVMASHSAARGASQGASDRNLGRHPVEEPQHPLEFGQLASEARMKFLLAQHT